MAAYEGSLIVEDEQQAGSWTFKDGTLVFTREDRDDPSLSIDEKQLVFIVPVDSDGSYIIAYVAHNAHPDADIKVETVKASGLPPGSSEQFRPLRPGLLGSGKATSNRTAELTFIVSAASGTRKAQSFFGGVLKPLLDDLGIGDHYQLHITDSADSITQLTASTIAPRANDGVAQEIVMLSGDGGPIDLVNAMLKQKGSSKYVAPALTVLPFGTGNALSNSYGYTNDVTNGLSTLFRGSRLALPCFIATVSDGARVLVDEGRKEAPLDHIDGRPGLRGLVVASWGLHSTLVADSDTEHYRKFGAERFGMVAKQLLHPEDGTEHHHYSGKVSLRLRDGNVKILDRETHSYILATLVSNLEKTFCISPASKALDGQLRVIEMPAMDGDRLMALMTAGYQDGKHIGMDDVGYHEVESMRIDFEEEDAYWRRICIDGKIVRVEEGGFLEVKLEQFGLVDIITLAK